MHFPSNWANQNVFYLKYAGCRSEEILWKWLIDAFGGCCGETCHSTCSINGHLPVLDPGLNVTLCHFPISLTLSYSFPVSLQYPITIKDKNILFCFFLKSVMLWFNLNVHAGYPCLCDCNKKRKNQFCHHQSDWIANLVFPDSVNILVFAQTTLNHVMLFPHLLSSDVREHDVLGNDSDWLLKL